jgi:hypothetical protein
VPTRYLSRTDLHTLLRSSGVPLAERAAAALDLAVEEMVPVSPGGLDTATYEVRFARTEAGEGPRTAGLSAFVEALRRPVVDGESAGFEGRDGAHFIVLLDAGEVAAVTVVEAP